MFLLLIDIALTILFLVAVAGATLVISGNLRGGVWILTICTLGTILLVYFQLPPYVRPFEPEIPEGFETFSPFIYSITATPLLVVAALLAIVAYRKATSI